MLIIADLVFQDLNTMFHYAGTANFFTVEAEEDEQSNKNALKRAKNVDDNGDTLHQEQNCAVRQLQIYRKCSFLQQTTKSLDWEGNVLVPLPDYEEILGIIKLTETELMHLKDVNQYIADM
ncbi:hypothetical protein H0H87_002811 [Tephrocybe sp. NHM501043]|nr:hypothetical protein H0H87_002811 [Tephrocybe sp. NHM501043]